MRIVVVGPHDPDPKLVLEPLVNPLAIVVRESDGELLRWFIEHIREHESPRSGKCSG